MSATPHYTPHYTQLPMVAPHSPASIFAMLVGGILLIEGLWGTVSPVVFGVLSTNPSHAVLHIALGVAGLRLGARRQASGYLLFLGGLLLVLGALYFVPGARDWLQGLLDFNTAMAVANIAVGGLALLVRRMP